MSNKGLINLIKISSFNMNRASEEQLNNKELICEIVSINGSCLEYCIDSMKNDVEVVLCAIKNNSFAFRYAGDKIKESKICIQYLLSHYCNYGLINYIILFINDKLFLDDDFVSYLKDYINKNVLNAYSKNFLLHELLKNVNKVKIGIYDKSEIIKYIKESKTDIVMENIINSISYYMLLDEDFVFNLKELLKGKDAYKLLIKKEKEAIEIALEKENYTKKKLLEEKKNLFVTLKLEENDILREELEDLKTYNRNLQRDLNYRYSYYLFKK